MSKLESVDVLIIGAGASGAAVAWSLAETRMRILCLEQGDWVNSSDYPSNFRDWETRQMGDFGINPKAPEDKVSDAIDLTLSIAGASLR